MLKPPSHLDRSTKGDLCQTGHKIIILVTDLHRYYFSSACDCINVQYTNHRHNYHVVFFIILCI